MNDLLEKINSFFNGIIFRIKKNDKPHPKVPKLILIAIATTAIEQHRR